MSKVVFKSMDDFEGKLNTHPTKEEKEKLLEELRRKAPEYQAMTARYLKRGREAFEESDRNRRIIHVVGPDYIP